MGSIHDTIKEKVELATIYADDGAFHTASRIFSELAETLSRHANACDEIMKGAEDEQQALRGQRGSKADTKHGRQRHAVSSDKNG